ncbi:hypothetical protein [Clostridium sp. OS1-26]|uniref:hypothetical protein n=1 Tax=Clostridium sp. OS1-26 TaxID=3070681 RepID=UPI0027DF9304|nr:hypothetical protein [Clostridium sp. OS1-26]WML37371.1 hypothetical protein RCG18_12580 [Clostridium sp. OS1-26]
MLRYQINKKIAFNILVAPAINWIDQGRYNTLKELEKKGATKEEISNKEKEFTRDLELLKHGASYEEYVKAVEKKKRLQLIFEQIFSSLKQ